MASSFDHTSLFVGASASVNAVLVSAHVKPPSSVTAGFVDVPEVSASCSFVQAASTSAAVQKIIIFFINSYFLMRSRPCLQRKDNFLSLN